jgi:hypothetical protein
MNDTNGDNIFLSILLPLDSNDTSSLSDEIDSDIEITSTFDAQ